MMFAAPPEMSLEWSDAGVDGAQRFLKRLWKLVHQHVDRGTAPALDAAALTDAQKQLRAQLHQTIAKVSDDIGRRYTFNTAIAANMELINALYKFTDGEDDSPQGRAVMQEALEAVVRTLAPIVPHITHELWQALGHAAAVIDAAWPQVDAAALVKDSVELVVQVNGKLRTRITVPAIADKETIEQAALTDDNVQRHIAGQHVRKIVIVPGRLVNIVVAA